MKLKDILLEIKSIELELGSGNGKKGWDNFVINWWDSELYWCEDREMVIEDLNRENGYVFGILNKWFSELEKSDEWECDLNCWEYSLEDLIRDNFGIGVYDSWELFSIEDINKQLYGEEY